MPDREKVIKGLEQFIADFKSFCGNNADWQRVYDALALLKAQEPVEPNLLVMNGRLSNGTKYICGGCGGSFFHQKVNFCPWCGRAVKWDG